MSFGLALLALLVCLTVFEKHHGATVSANASPETTKVFPRLGVEITTDSSDKTLYVPVGLVPGKSPIAYVPVKDGGYISAVRVTPVMEDGVVKLDVSAVSGDYRAGKCDELKTLPARLLGKHSLNKGESVVVQDDLVGAPWKVTVKAVDLRPPVVIGRQKTVTNPKASSFQDPGVIMEESAAPCGCASCGSREHPLLCCPNLGQCLGCSTCGTVCCPAG